jgi:hypothetical protein
MRKLNYITAFILIFYSCNDVVKKQAVFLTSEKIELTDRFKSILIQFSNENPCKDCINKIYIDKVYSIGEFDHKTIITLQQIPFSRKDFTKLKPTPLLSVDVDSTKFFIFSGLEDYFTISNNKIDSASNSLGNKYAVWTIVDTKDSLIIRKKGMSPFSPFPLPDIASIDSTKKK